MHLDMDLLNLQIRIILLRLFPHRPRDRQQRNNKKQHTIKSCRHIDKEGNFHLQRLWGVFSERLRPSLPGGQESPLSIAFSAYTHHMMFQIPLARRQDGLPIESEVEGQYNQI